MEAVLVLFVVFSIWIWGIIGLYNIKRGSARRRPFDIRDFWRK